MEGIKYKGDYKYQLHKDYVVTTTIKQDKYINTKFISLSPEGTLTIRVGYAWDGPSRPAIHTRNFMRASLVHDALYQLMREDELDRCKFKEPADRLLRSICKEDGMNFARAWWVYKAVSWCGHEPTYPEGGREIKYAPKGCP